jgi:hypothetical protein
MLRNQPADEFDLGGGDDLAAVAKFVRHARSVAERCEERKTTGHFFFSSGRSPAATLAPLPLLGCRPPAAIAPDEPAAFG